MAEAGHVPESGGYRVPPVAQVIWTALVAAGFLAFYWLAPGGEAGRTIAAAAALIAFLVFLFLPTSGLLAQVMASLALAALGGAVVWLALETRAVVMAIALYFVLWWTLLFAVLPWGVRSQHEAEEVTPGSDPGAPVKPLLLRKVFATSVVAAVVLAIVLLFLYFRPIPNVLPFAGN
jgi:predicted secreted protein